MGAAIQRSYSAEEIEAGLLELACWHGNDRQAARCLAERGFELPRETLRDWAKYRHVERYEEIRAQVLPAIRAKLAAQQEVIAQRAAEVTMTLLERLEDEAPEISARDLAGAVRNTETTAAVAIDKHSVLHGLPTEIRQTENAEEILKRLAAKGIVVDGTAEEIPAEGGVRQLPRPLTPPNAQDASRPQPSTSAPSEHDD